MRFASWNMSHAIKKDPVGRAAAWGYLRGLGVDVAMVQEAGLPIPLTHISEPTPGTRNWITAVVSCGAALHSVSEVRTRWRQSPFLLPDKARRGSIALAEVDVPGAPSILAVSLYGVLNYAAQSVLLAASDLLPVFDSEFRERVVVAGDLNMHTASRDKGERSRTVQILGLLEAFGLCDLLRDAGDKKILTQRAAPCPCKYKPCSHVRTHRHRRHRADAIGSIDYMFASNALAKRLQSVVVLNGDDDPSWAHSDHAPLIAEFRM
jgi:endonuclease/exonuclease/phosphatase family metal-dependent hydrolase